jgi:hypothetical protein
MGVGGLWITRLHYVLFEVMRTSARNCIISVVATVPVDYQNNPTLPRILRSAQSDRYPKLSL